MSGEPFVLVELARRVGPHALAAFLALLTASTLAGGALFALMRHRRVRAASGESAPDRIVLRLAAGFGTMVLAALVFAWIARHIAPDGSLGLADQALADAIALHLAPGALAFFAVVTHAGDPSLLAALAVVVSMGLWRLRQRALMLGWLLALAGNAALNPLLKQIFERVRPLHDHGLAQATGFSFPSGHTSGAMVAYGMLAYLAVRLAPPRWHVAATMAAIAMVLATACSRVFLRVHFASDVVAGLLSGGVWLAVCIVSLTYARYRRERAGSR
jgi:membrane-associated phospholipid phosphatase